MRFEDDTVVVEYTDILLVMSAYIRRYKFTHENHMPVQMIVEVPYQAWDLAVAEPCLCIAQQIEGDPPAKWFAQAVRHDLQQAPTPSTAPPVVDNLPSPAQPKIHQDEMVMSTGSSNIIVTPSEPKTSMLAPRAEEDEEPIIMMSGDIEDNDLYTIPVEELTVEDSPLTEVLEGDHAIGEGDDNSIPGGLERTSEHDRAAEAIRTANSPTTQSDGDV